MKHAAARRPAPDVAAATWRATSGGRVLRRLGWAIALGVVAAVSDVAASAEGGTVRHAPRPLPAPGVESPPLAPAPAPFVELSTVIPDVVQELRYAGPDNLTGAALPGYGAPRCWLLPAAAAALARAQAMLRPHGLGLKVFDCYRPQRAVAHLVRWSRGPGEGAGAGVLDDRPDYHPRTPRAEVFRAGYFARESQHSRGITVDVTLVPRGATANPPRAGGPPCTLAAPGGSRDGELDLGTGYDCLDAAAQTQSAAVAPQARALRLLLVQTMRQAGFVNYRREWWHFTLAGAPPSPAYDLPLR